MCSLARLFFYCFVFSASKNFAQSIALFEQHNGRYDYTALGNTLNLIENGVYSDCSILESSSAELNLLADQTVVAAYLYWAGSGTGDFETTLNGVSINADRIFTHSLDSNRQFFAGFSDITELVLSQGNGLYTLSDLNQINTSEAYCLSGTNFAGWAIIIIYEDLVYH